MKYIVLLSMCVIFLSGCNTSEKEKRSNTTDMTSMNEMNHDGMENHIGCQENELDEDGNCVPAEDNNRMLFDQDLSSQVVSQDVIEWELMGYLSEPVWVEDAPWVVMIHEWWGLNDNIKYMADVLASEGYRVFAIDLYNGNVAETSDEAWTLARAVRWDTEGAVRKMELAKDFLQRDGKSRKIASYGWCFWGQQSFNLALNTPLDASVVYYGNVPTEDDMIANIGGPILGIFGTQDSGIPVQWVEEFAQKARNLWKEIELHYYEAGHAFANPSGWNYEPEATLDAWDKTLQFLDSQLR